VDGADESGAREAGLDPIFHATEPPENSPKSVTLLWQFFLFPLLVVAAAVGVFVAFGAIGGGSRSPQELLQEVLTGGENAQKQAAQQLAILLAEERNRVDRGEDPEKPPFYAQPEFLRDLARAFETARKEDLSEERQILLARALGRTGHPGVVPLLESVLYPVPGEREGMRAPSRDLRRAAAAGLLFLESRVAEAALVRAASDEDAEVRAIAVNALALLGSKQGGAAMDGPGTAATLLRALEDPHSGVAVNAAVALAVRGDPAGRHLIERSLDRDALAKLGVPPAFQEAALKNAIKGATTLRDPTLKPLVERLSDAKYEGDGEVRDLARQALARWDRKEKD
jgi:hypothetical protein